MTLFPYTIKHAKIIFINRMSRSSHLPNVDYRDAITRISDGESIADVLSTFNPKQLDHLYRLVASATDSNHPTETPSDKTELFKKLGEMIDLIQHDCNVSYGKYRDRRENLAKDEAPQIGPSLNNTTTSAHYNFKNLGIEPEITEKNYRNTLLKNGWLHISYIANAITPKPCFSVSPSTLKKIAEYVLDKKAFESQTFILEDHIYTEAHNQVQYTLCSPKTQELLLSELEQLEKYAQSIPFPSHIIHVGMQNVNITEKEFARNYLSMSQLTRGGGVGRRNIQHRYGIELPNNFNKFLFNRNTSTLDGDDIIYDLAEKRKLAEETMGITSTDYLPYIITIPQLDFDENGKPKIIFHDWLSKQAARDFIHTVEQACNQEQNIRTAC